MHDADPSRTTWKGKTLGDMSSIELSAAVAWLEGVKRELDGHAPPPVWSWFNMKLADLTLERVRRLRPPAKPTEPTEAAA